MEQLDYHLLFRWFVGLNMDDAVWDTSNCCSSFPRILFSYQAALWKQESFLVPCRTTEERYFAVANTIGW
jgi:hypothetical protein